MQDIIQELNESGTLESCRAGSLYETFKLRVEGDDPVLWRTSPAVTHAAVHGNKIEFWCVFVLSRFRVDDFDEGASLAVILSGDQLSIKDKIGQGRKYVT